MGGGRRGPGGHRRAAPAADARGVGREPADPGGTRGNLKTGLFPQRAGAEDEYVQVRKRDLERLTTEVMQMRDVLPRLLSGEVLDGLQKLKVVEKSEWRVAARARPCRQVPVASVAVA